MRLQGKHNITYSLLFILEPARTWELKSGYQQQQQQHQQRILLECIRPYNSGIGHDIS